MSKTNPEIKWIKIATNVFSDEKILLIEQMPDADTILVIWFKLLCMAGRENNCGVFMMGNKIPYTDEMLATIFRRPLATVRLALSTFDAFGMIEIISDPMGNDVYAIPNWEKHQNIDGMDKIREQARKRVAKHREAQRLALMGKVEEKQSNVTCNVTVTQCNATEKEEEKEKEKEEEKKKENKKKSSASFVADDDLNAAIISFMEFRKKIKKPMTETAIKLMIEKLNKLTPNIKEQIEIINQSILNGWQGIFPLKQETTNQQPQRNNRFCNFEQRKEDYNEWEERILKAQAKANEIDDP